MNVFCFVCLFITKLNWDVVLPKLQYCRVIRRLCDKGVICGRLIDSSSPYDAVDRHFCNFFPPCERDFRIESDDDDIVYCAVITPRLIGLPVAAVALFVRSCKLGIDDTVPDDDGPPHNPFIWFRKMFSREFKSHSPIDWLIDWCFVDGVCVCVFVRWFQSVWSTDGSSVIW